MALAALAAFVAAAAVYGILLYLERQALAPYAREAVWVAARPIPRGSRLSSPYLEDWVREVRMEASMIPKGAVREKSDLEGRILAWDLGEGMVVGHECLLDGEDMTAGMEHPVLAGFRAEDLYQAVGGVLRSGDRVHIYALDRESGIEQGVWENVYVCQVFDQQGKEILDADGGKPAGRINILLEKRDAPLFYEAILQGELCVVKDMGD